MKTNILIHFKHVLRKLRNIKMQRAVVKLLKVLLGIE